MFILCFISQWMKKSKHGLFVFPPKKTLIWRRHPSIGQWCCSMTSKRSIDWFLESSRAWEVFSPERSLNQSKATSVCICSTNQSYCSISVRLLFLFCSRVFISRAYENRSIFRNLTHQVWFVFCTCVPEKVEGNEYKLIIFKNTVCFNSLNSNSFLEIFFP